MNNKARYLITLLAIITGISGAVWAQSVPDGMMTNKLNPYGGADPWIQFYDGYYYLATTTWRSELIMLKSPTIAGLKIAVPLQIYAETDPSRCCNMWAPEFHLLEGPDGKHWYYYYSAGTSGTLANQHTHVLESAGIDPMGPYHYKGRIFDATNDVWAIDGTILQHEDSLYFLYSAGDGQYQSIFIALLENPWTISGERVLLSQPTFNWEQVGGAVNEGPVVLYNDGDIFLIYSASSCATADYKLGMLEFIGTNPLNPNDWVKYPDPIFSRSDSNGVYGTGHNGFFKSADGTEDWIVYHANDTVTGGCDDGRTTRVQKFNWKPDGTPYFGEPVSTTQLIEMPSGDGVVVDPISHFEEMVFSRFRSMIYESGFLRHWDIVARVDVEPSPAADAQFWVIPGLADPNAVSIRSINLPGYFLHHKSNAIVFGPNDGTAEFAQSATWRIQEGLANPEWISFEAYNKVGFYISRQFGVMALVQGEHMTDSQREEATFLEEQ